MGYYDIPVEKSSCKGTSRYNEKEAEQIVFWLIERYHEIFKIYNYYDKNILDRDILAIITPFKEQVNVLKEMLQKYMGEKGRNIDVGTVHTFQGGERKIIIMSTVYGSSDNCYFINGNRSLMNVAVSRAKDAFWMFGAYECLDDISKNTVSGILKKYICQGKISN